MDLRRWSTPCGFCRDVYLGEVQKPMATLILNGPESLLTTTEAANLCGVQQSTIRKWQQRGYLQPRGRNQQERNLYNIIDLARAEKATRERARRT